MWPFSHLGFFKGQGVCMLEFFFFFKKKGACMPTCVLNMCVHALDFALLNRGAVVNESN